MLLFVFLFYTIDIRTPLSTISIWQNKPKKKTIGREEGVGGREGISPSTPRTTWHPEMITFSSQPEIPTEIILSLKSFKGVTVGSLEKKKERSTNS